MEYTRPNLVYLRPNYTTPRPLIGALDAERVRCENAVRIGLLPNPLQLLVLLTIVVVPIPIGVKVPVAPGTPEHTSILLREYALGPQRLLVVYLLPVVGAGFGLGITACRQLPSNLSSPLLNENYKGELGRGLACSV